ncbi:MAG: DNA polymerase I, partial [Muribaculaceae bacterium]|nr:DNA polymerase I [Muribaculaceae bacterium]
MPVADAPKEVDHSHYLKLDNAEAVAAAVTDALTHERVGVSLYAEGPDAMTAVWRGLALSTAKGSAVYLEIPTEKKSREAIKQLLAPLFVSDTTCVVSHDVKRDYIVLKREGIELGHNYYDTSVAHYLLQPEMRHDLSSVCSIYLNYHTSDYAQASTAPSRTVRKPQTLTPDEARVRTCEAADLSLRLDGVFRPQIEAEGLATLMCDVELPLIQVLAEMEWTGVRINVHELAELSRQLTARLTEMEHEAYQLAGGEFNIASPMQVGEILFERLKIDPKAKRTKRGAYSTTEEILEKHRHTVPLVDLILKIRALRKLLTTYINALPALINPATGKIHTSYNQTVTATGRISSTNPNLQNIPVRTNDGREIRRAFIPDNGDLLLSADYSQIELRLMADMSQDPDMIEAFLSGADIHRATAAKIYHESLDSVTDNQRRNAKTANFGIIYGISAFGLSERLGIPRPEAKMLIDAYFRTYTHVKDYMEESIEIARKQGYVSTIMGRKRMLPDINSRNNVVRSYAERNAINAPLQGSAADIIKLAMVRIYRRFVSEGLRSRMIMQVHDELVFNVVPDELPRVQEIVTAEMQGAYSGRVPLTVSAGVGNNWLEAH